MKGRPSRMIGRISKGGGPIRLQLEDDSYLTFIHNPKTAGISITHWLYDTYKQENWKSILYGNERLVKSFESYNVHWGIESVKNLSAWKDIGKTFVVVRHPYSRFVSFWNWENYSKKDNMTFEECWNFWKTAKTHQSIYWKGCDITIRYENLQVELDEKISLPIFGRPSTLDTKNFLNRSYSLEEASEIIPKSIQEEICELDKDTFDEFGYEKDVG